MLAFHLLTLLCNSDPATGDRPEVSAALLTNCVRRVARTAEPICTCAFTDLAVANRSPGSWLALWEHAVRAKEDWDRSQREAFRHQSREDFNEHSVAALEQFVGQIDARRLSETFRWRIVAQTYGQVCLEAMARDDVEGLFYGSMRVWLRTDDGCPIQLAVVGRNGRSRTAWRTNQPPKVIEFAQYESDVPPAPEVVSTASDSRVE